MYANQYSNSSRMAYGGVTSSSLKMDETAAVANLQHLSREELQQLLETDGKLDDMINDLKQVKDINIERETALASNKSLADYNLSLQPRFQQLKQMVATDYEQLNSLKTELATAIAKLDEHTSQQSLDTLLAVLQTEAAKAEEETEDLASDFCSKKVDLDEFLSRYIPLRMEAHTKRIKAEKMSEIIRNPSSGSQSNYSGVGGYSSSSAPYPINNAVGMPQPSLPYPRYQ